jgi:hypothetical protein
MVHIFERFANETMRFGPNCKKATLVLMYG